MSIRSTILGALIAVSAVVPSGGVALASEIRDNQADIASIKAIAEDARRMHETADVSIARRIYAKDFEGGPVVIIPTVNGEGGNRTIGYENAVAQIAWFAKPEHLLKNYKLSVSEPPRILIRGDMAAVAAIWDVDITRRDGNVHQVQSRYTMILRKIGGNWKIWHEQHSYPRSVS